MPIPLTQHPKLGASAAKEERANLTAWWSRDLFVFNKGLNDHRKERLFRELHLLLQAGVDPRTVLDLLIKAQTDPRSVEVLEGVRTAVVRGQLLSDALQAAGSFSSYEVHSVRIGEESGRLGEVCLQLADHHADRLKLQRMVRQAFAYPAFILAITMVVVLFMMKVVVPMFAQVFARSGAELPALTRTVLEVAAFLDAWWFVLVLLALGAGAGYFALRTSRAWQVAVETTLLKLPLFGELRRKALLAKYARAMALLLGSGAPLDRALDLCQQMVGSPKLMSALHQVRADVVKGTGLAHAMTRHPLFDPAMIAMIAVAEEVKQLDAMHLRLSERYTADVQHRTALLGTVLEPATILLIAVLVGTVLVAMYLPMFKLSTTF
jgi:type IV pilus assembly protein PilC